MPLYTYKAINSTGKSVHGRIDAANVLDLEQRLSHMELSLVSGAPTQQTSRIVGGGKITRKDLINFCFHLEQLTSAGVPIVEGLIDLRDSVENPRFKEVVGGLVESIQGGRTLSQALTDYTEVFGRVFASLIRSGEHTGKLPEVLRSLSESIKWDDELAAQMKKMLMYPIFVGGIVLLVTFFLMIYLVPQMTAFIRNMGQELPLQTIILIHVSNFCVNYWWVIIAIPPAIFFGLRYAAQRNPAIEYALDRYKLQLPVVGPVMRKIILSRFASSFGMMYSSGLTVLDAIRSAEEILGNRPMEEALRSAGRQIAGGKAMTLAFQDAGLFPPLVIRMLKIGEATGGLDKALLNVSYFYGREVRDSMAKIQAMIEPALTVVLGALLGWVMVAVMGPVYDTISKMKF